MKYVLHHASPAIIWPGFHIETKTVAGAAKLAAELNRLDKDMNDWAVECHKAQAERDGLRKELDVQIEAKNNALRKVTDLEALGVELELKLKGSPTNRALKQRLSVRTSQVRELLDVLDRCQSVLATYLQPEPRMKPKAVLSDLLDVLDDSALVTRMRHLSDMLRRRPLGWETDGSVELTCLQKAHVLQALDETALLLRNYTSEQPASYAEACRILGASEDGDVQEPPYWATHKFQDHEGWKFGKLTEGGYYIDSDNEATATQVWTGKNFLAGTLTALGVSKKFPEVGDEMLVTLKRGSDGKQYLSGLGVDVQDDTWIICSKVGEPIRYRNCRTGEESAKPFTAKPFIVQADQVFINGACIEKSAVSAMELGTAIHEGLERVVNNTTNHFVPSKKLKRRVKKLRARVSELENERDELLSEIRANAERD